MPTYIFDDVYGDQRPGSQSPRAVYEPPWNMWDPAGGTCWGCTLGTNLPIPINPHNATMETCHTVTVKEGDTATNVSITFVGTSINAYCILPPNTTSPFIQDTFLSFTSDEMNVGFFEWTGTTSQWTYNYLVFSRENLTQGEHTFIISPQNQGSKWSFLVLDYFTYK
ncbi:hypothetical protein PHLGIDRAFT_454993 [Phlebiopsis gigantea 11061_1 CR5-6]|uniref:Carbohydrate-binding module family 35 protein n=1 Tax=Phlebiopsis gigantea (strain 11061_1 CR5-6) TaxID=745531 RepID=A0A0C3S5X6_PHLG1|nr:hypothetical protein PHLGIDRAFT_454993 [Phlebiopsis gigantea 11061_1 CR5-6]